MKNPGIPAPDKLLVSTPELYFSQVYSPLAGVISTSLNNSNDAVPTNVGRDVEESMVYHGNT